MKKYLVGREYDTIWNDVIRKPERMLIILEDRKEADAKKIFDKWDLDFVIIGKWINTNNLTLKFNDKIIGEIPIEALSSKAPIYDRKQEKTKKIRLI